MAQYFADGKYTDVAGLCKVATIAEIEAQGWSLNPGRYVGVADREEDDFDFKERLEEQNEEILKGERAGYGEQIVSTVLRQLEAEYGRGFSEKSLRHMLSFSGAFPDERIVSALSRQLSWSHFKEIIYLTQPLQKDFYAEMCRVERWSVRTLRLFFHRRLRRLVVIELKLDKFKPAFKGQMELYLRWLDKYERREGEEAPLGMILCAGKKQEQIELLELDRSGIHVANIADTAILGLVAAFQTVSLASMPIHAKLIRASSNIT